MASTGESESRNQLGDEYRRLLQRVRELESLDAVSEQSVLFHLIEHAPIGIGVLDRQFRYIAVNRRMAEMNGLPAERHPGLRVEDVAPQVAAQLRQPFERVLATAAPVLDQEVFGAPADDPNSTRYWSMTWFPLTEAGEVTAVAGMVFDITERKRIEQALRKSESALAESHRLARVQLAEIETLYAAAPIGLALVDTDFRYVRLNRRLAEMNGIPAEASVGKTVREVIPELWPQVEPIYRRVIGTRESVHDVPARGSTSADPGNIRDWLTSYDPVFDPDGTLLGVSILVQDVTESNRARASIEESEQRARRQLAEIEAVYESAPIPLCSYDDQLRFTRVNQLMAELNGVSAEAHLGKTVREIAPDFGDQAGAAMQKVMQTGEPLLDFEMVGRAADRPDDVRYWNNRWTPVKDENGRVVGISVAVEEVTDRRKAEEQLRRSERLYRAVGETIDYGVWVCTPEGDCTYVSDSFLKLLGMTQEECAKSGWSNFLHPDEREATLAAWQECAKSGHIWDREHRYLGADGQYHAVLARGVPVRDLNGEIVCWAGINLDIAGIKSVQESLRASEHRERERARELEAIMDAVPVAVFILRDAETRTVAGNRMSYDLMRLPPRGSVSDAAPLSERPQNFRAFHKGREIPRDELPLFVAGRTGRAVCDAEFEMLFDDGESRHVIGNAVPLFHSNGEPYGSVGAFVDVTERRRGEARLLETQKLDSLGLLAGGIAHDFNNLLVGIIGNASLAQEILPPGDPTTDILAEVVKTGERAAELTRQMLAYAGKGRFVVGPLNLSTTITEMRPLMQPALQKRTTLQMDLRDELPPVDADAGQIRQVILALVMNAAEAIGEATGWISVRTGVASRRDFANDAETRIGELTEKRTYVYLEVRDNGCGMDAVTQAKIFDPFFSTKFTGRGLGLAAVSGIVRSHGGALKVRSAKGAGSTFTMFLPVSTEPAIGGVLAAQPRQESQKMVLVVDDEPTVGSLARRALERYGHTVVVVDSGAAAIEEFRQRRNDFGMVILDLSMPGMSGEETLPELQRIRADIPIVVSSGYTEKQAMKIFEGQKVAGFLQKPYTSNRIVELVRSMLGE